MPPTVRPSGVERTFGRDEIIVSKTDPQGRITYANDVFCRMAAMSEAEILGQPHNVIRHPDMPRGVFGLLWETIQRGEDIFAYVVNLAADGSHYWVLAHVTPTVDASGRITGYHSNRRNPDRSSVAEIQGLYALLLAEEGRHGGAVAAAAAGRQYLSDLLEEKGRTYDELLWSVTREAV